MADSSVAEAGTPTHAHAHTHSHTQTLSASVDTVQMLAALFEMKAGQPANNLNHSDMFTIILFWDSGHTHMCIRRRTQSYIQCAHTRTHTVQAYS